MREAVVAQLRCYAELLNTRCSDQVRDELFTAVGSFAETADLSKLGEVQDALSAVGAVDEEFGHTHPAEGPPWMASYNEARHTGFAGGVLWELGMQSQFVAETRG